MIDFIDLKAQRERIRANVDAAVQRVMDHGQFINGPEVAGFERDLCDFTGAVHALGCASGTDALQLVLMAEGIGPGDAVFVPAFTFVASAEVMPLLGATPVFVDVLDDTFNIDPESLEDTIKSVKADGLTPRMVIAVDLYGQPADYPAIQTVADRHGLVVVADAAQSLGGRLNGKSVATLADWTTTSFFPSKPLGCYGDGGAVFTRDGDKAALVRSLGMHGKGKDKYDNVRVGVNSRLDTLQAAILIEKLAVFEDELQARDRIAAAYTAQLGGVVETPVVAPGAFSAWAQYTVKLDDRAAVQAHLKAAGVPTAVYYPIPLHCQTGYLSYPTATSLATAERLAARVLSLPMHPYLDGDTQQRIIVAVKDAVVT